MNKSKIEWCDYTWNPITGCKHGCEYCYARALARRGMGRYAFTGFEPFFHEDRLDEPAKAKKPSKIFVGSMGDLLGDWRWHGWEDVPVQYGIEFSASRCARLVADAMKTAPQHTYICLTKAWFGDDDVASNAEMLADAGAWIGTSICGDRRKHCDESTRLAGFLGDHMSDALRSKRFISFEPVMGDAMYFPLRQAIADGKIKWLIVGGMTGRLAKQYPAEYWKYEIETLAINCEKFGVAFFAKDNLGMPDLPQQFPKEMEPNNA